MHAIGLSQEKYNRVFGPKAEAPITGKSRLCKVCGGWHRLDRPWPHNCRSEAPKRNRELSVPQLAPSFQPFQTGNLPGAAIITNRAEKQDYMERNELVEYDPGVSNDPNWVEQLEYERGIVEDIKRFEQTDPLNLSPDLKAQPMEEAGSLENGTQINTTDIEVVA